MKTIRFVLLSSLFLVLTCCSGSKKTDGTIDCDLVFDSLKVEKTYHLFQDTAMPSCNLKINFIYPSDAADKSLLDSLQSIFISRYFGNDYIGKTPQDAIESYKKRYIAGYKQYEDKNNPEVAAFGYKKGNTWGSSFSYYESSHNNIHYNDENIVCFSVHFENYTGGAHGSTRNYGTTIDLNTQKIITEKDIFGEDNIDKISAIIIQKIAEQSNITNPEELENMGYYGINEINTNGNFLVNKEGITYIYNEYEIAPYMMGRTVVFLPYKEIKIYINPQAAISKLAL